MSILRLALKACAMPRAIGVDGVYSRQVQATRGITAGSGTATAELRALVLDLLDILEETHPEVLAAVYVDDINLEVKIPIPPANPGLSSNGTQAQRRRRLRDRARTIQLATATAADVMTRALNDTVAYFQDWLGMQVSTTKSAVTASNAALAERVAASTNEAVCTPATAKRKKFAKMLGVATSGGTRRVSAEYNRRLAAFKEKKRRFLVLKGMGFNTKAMVRATAMPSIAYGLDVHGIADSRLSQLRSTVLRTFSPNACGGLAEAEWYARDGSAGRDDPAFLAHSLPIVALANAWFERWRPEDQLTLAHQQVMQSLRSWYSRTGDRNASVWGNAKGPTTAAILSAGRLGWSFRDAYSIETDDGSILDLRRDAPAAVKNAVDKAVIRWRAANLLEKFTTTTHLLKTTIRPPPHVTLGMQQQWRRANAMASIQHFPEVIGSLSGARESSCEKRKNSGWSSAYAPYLISAVAGRQWPQARAASVKKPGWPKDPRCRLCMKADGTLDHRHTCAAIAERCSDCPPPQPSIANALLYSSQQALSLWRTRGIGGFRVFIPNRPLEGRIQWLMTPKSHVDPASLDWYVDASLVDGTLGPCARYGVAGIAVDMRGHLVAAWKGVPPDYVQSIGEAEAWALATVLSRRPAGEECLLIAKLTSTSWLLGERPPRPVACAAPEYGTPSSRLWTVKTRMAQPTPRCSATTGWYGSQPIDPRAASADA